MRLRSFIRVSLALMLVAGVATVSAGSSSAAVSDAAWAKKVCGQVPADELLRTYNGNRADRSGDIQFFTDEAPGGGSSDFVGSGLPHVGSWDYVQTLPMLWYGPGYIKPGVTVKRPVSLADIAPTQGELLNFPFQGVDSRPMSEALLPAGERKTPPKLVITMIWDAAGMDVLDEWPKAWPFLKSLQKQGTWYSDATVGTAPTSTAQDHATIGTGAFPKDNALVAHHFRIGDQMTTPWSQGSRLLDLPTFADLYDINNDNKPIIAAVGSVPIHMGMESHGTTWGGGDKDIAIITNVNNLSEDKQGQESPTWGLIDSLRPFYSAPTWVDPDQDPTTVDYRPTQYQQAVDMVDRMDGKADGKWGKYDLNTDETLHGFESPARIPWETSLLEDLITKQHMGQDATPDMLFANYKVIDYVSHVQSMNSTYMEDSVKVQDDSLKEFVAWLDANVGKGNYVLNITADHGAMPDPNATGAFVASPGKIGSAINTEFGAGTVMLTQNSTVFLNVPLLESNNHTIDEVANFIAGLTKGQTYLEGSKLDQSQANDKLFSSVFPSRLLPELSCIKNAPLN